MNPFRGEGTVVANAPESTSCHSIPQDFEQRVQIQIESLLPSGKLHIDTVAESLEMSRRTLQRRLAEQHQTYSQLLSEIRFNIAAKKLKNSDQTIAEIAFELGYVDASNFTRAFRKKTGGSPLYFRQTSVEPTLNDM
jgi:AraC-like DNA-binding protein